MPDDERGRRGSGRQGDTFPVAWQMLEWTAPKGTWTVLLVDHEFRTSPTRSERIRSA